jgi:methionyl-tRNA formyltransferase
MRMEARLDTGPVYLHRNTPIATDETGGSLHDRLARLGAEALLDCIDQLLDGSLPDPLPQDDRLATYAHKLDKAEAQIDWTRPAEEIERLVRAFNPWPVAWFELQGERLRVWAAEAIGRGRALGTPGHVMAADDAGIDICAGSGGLRLHEVQRPGGRRMPVADFLRARPIQAGR